MARLLAAQNVHWARPVGGASTGVLVLAGSSGRLDTGRAALLARAGATALAVRWFGGPGQPDRPCEIALETFVEALDQLAEECDRLALLGLSYGAEAALLTAVRDPRLDAVIALAPTDVAWEGQHRADGDPRRSKWTWQGEEVPFVPLDRNWTPPEPPAFAPLYERSLACAGADVVAAATIGVERFAGEMVLVAGGDDQVWPSTAAARRIVARREQHSLATTLVEDPRAGHPVVLPGEEPPDPRRPYRVGGDAGAAERLGTLAWPEIRRVLHVDHGGRAARTLDP